jgi:hypothetical protein
MPVDSSMSKEETRAQDNFGTIMATLWRVKSMGKPLLEDPPSYTKEKQVVSEKVLKGKAISHQTT